MSHCSGDLLGGRYALDDRIATGGMGEVWHGTDELLHRPVAVKTLRADRATDPQFRSRFQHEARAMATLHHPGIAEVYDFADAPADDAYLVMAFVQGQPLSRRIDDRGRLTVVETMSIVAQVGRALQAAHDAGIVHRDVKPGNIIVQPDGRAVLVDFGVAHSARSDPLTGANEVIGTAHYLAPEQVSKGAVGAAADVYALGAVAYHCLAGRPPFVGSNAVVVSMQQLKESPPPLPADVPSPVRALVATALAKDPADRFRSAAVMARAAEEVVTPIGSRVVRTAHVPPPPHRRNRRPYLILLVLAVLALAGAAVGLALAGTFDSSVPSAPASVAPSTHPESPGTSNGSDPATRTSAPAPARTSAPTRTSRSASPTPSTSAPPTSASPSASASASPTTGTGPTTTAPATTGPQVPSAR
jgi:eukaryotic-like serine/threonine-protein kinase